MADVPSIEFRDDARVIFSDSLGDALRVFVDDTGHEDAVNASRRKLRRQPDQVMYGALGRYSNSAEGAGLKAQTRATLQRLFPKLESATRTRITDIEAIRACCPGLGGVYAIWRIEASSELIYIGETCHLQHRLEELSWLGRHAFSKRVVKSDGLPLVAPARSTHPFWSSLFLSWLPLELGRAELEEFVVATRVPKYNSKPVRLRLRDDAVDFLMLNAAQPDNEPDAVR